MRIDRALIVATLAAAVAVSGCSAEDEETAETAESSTATIAPAGSAPAPPSSAGEPDDERPPLPTAPPTGPRVDRYLQAVPDDFEPVAWTDLPQRPPLTGPLAVNRLITNAELHGERVLVGAEDVAPGLDGHLYTGTADGGIWRIVTDGTDVERIERVATVDGRPLGIDAYSDGVIVVAVALRGLVAVDTTTGDAWVLSDRLDGQSIFFADGVSVATDGTIYFTEASTRYYPGFPTDFLDGRPSGRLLRYEPTTGVTDVVAIACTSPTASRSHPTSRTRSSPSRSASASRRSRWRSPRSDGPSPSARA